MKRIFLFTLLFLAATVIVAVQAAPRKKLKEKAAVENLTIIQAQPAKSDQS